MINNTIQITKDFYGDLPIQYEWLYGLGALILFTLAFMTVALMLKPIINMAIGRWQ